jgi:hypothetical protein
MRGARTSHNASCSRKPLISIALGACLLSINKGENNRKAAASSQHQSLCLCVQFVSSSRVFVSFGSGDVPATSADRQVQQTNAKLDIYIVSTSKLSVLASFCLLVSARQSSNDGTLSHGLIAHAYIDIGIQLA